jgi:hypothetical protein
LPGRPSGSDIGKPAAMTATSGRSDGGKARRTRRTGERRSHRVDVRLSDAERDLLAAKAQAGGVSVARLLVDAAVGVSEVDPGERAPGVMADLMRVRRLLANVAGNVNQLAHVANQSQLLPAERELRELEQEVKIVLGELRAITDPAGRRELRRLLGVQ